MVLVLGYNKSRGSIKGPARRSSELPFRAARPCGVGRACGRAEAADRLARTRGWREGRAQPMGSALTTRGDAQSVSARISSGPRPSKLPFRAARPCAASVGRTGGRRLHTRPPGTHWGVAYGPCAAHGFSLYNSRRRLKRSRAQIRSSECHFEQQGLAASVGRAGERKLHTRPPGTH